MPACQARRLHKVSPPADEAGSVRMAVEDVALRAVQLFQVPAELGRLAGPECFGLL